MKYKKLIFLLVVIGLNSCHSENKIYQRVGGDHLTIKSGERELFWFSGMHGSNPQNPMFRDISHEFLKFHPDLVLVEGNANYFIPDDSLSAIKRGESVYVAYLAKQNNLPCEGLEPPDSSLNHFLMKNYTTDEILSMYIIRQMVQWGREKSLEPVFEERLIRFANEINHDLNDSVASLTLDQIALILKPYTQLEDLNNENWRGFDAKKYLYFSTNDISEIYQKALEYRNVYLVEFIREKFKSHQRIFVMMGFDHARETEEELRLMMQ
jgi:hypothetical protein